MAQTLFSPHRQNLQICGHCKHGLRIKLDLPARGPENVILRSGRVLSVAETERVEQAYSKTDAFVDKLWVEIDSLEKVVKRLKSAARELEEMQDVQEAYLAPVRKLPAEVLSEIFKLLCGDTSVELAEEYCEPMVLSAVCKTWRDIMHNMRGLWTDFVLPKRCSAIQTTQSLVNRLETFLQNSGDLPLRHCVQYEVGFSANRISERGLDTLLKYSHRWNSLKLYEDSMCVWRSTTKNIFSKLFGHPLTSLTTIHGHANDLAHGNEKGLFMIPSLRCVTLTQDKSADVVPDLPWAQLEELNTNTLAAYAMNIVLQCRDLVIWKHNECSITGASVTVPEQIAVLPRLQEVRLSIRGTEGMKIPDRLNAPALQEASIHWLHDNWFYDGNCLGMLVHSSPHIRQLALSNPVQAEYKFIGSLRELTSLSIGSAYTHPIPQDFIRELGAVDGGGMPRILPLLQSFGLRGHVDFDAPALAEMAEAWLAMGRPLKNFAIGYLKPVRRPGTLFVWDDESKARLTAAAPTFEARGWTTS
ncbi:hypothetical protein BD626DRAFT_455888 [Schizophyllum amplum]|uniref:Uncharacterized protein n=1 Tax=Schizophyllum amplum TaxID=97359 RepID=A0A550CI74_9AGAR|nr:hypothetical protein BD626DRAFT_455888 [Auriculariopsis ampla]